MIMNILVVLLVGVTAWILAAYGFFSALLHFACVVVAGAIAFAAWEPIVMLFLGSKMPDYAWGLTLVVVFSLSLFILRLIVGKACPAQVHFSTTTNFIGGGVLGAASGVLTIGMLLLGIQMLQMPSEMLGYRGWKVDEHGEVNRPSGTSGHLWLPVDDWTAKFYTWASKGSMYAPNNLARWYPDLARAASLYSESINSGESRQGLGPDQVKVQGVYEINDEALPSNFLDEEAKGINRAMQAPGNRFKLTIVDVLIDNAAADKGDKLRLTKAQVYLVCRTDSPEETYEPIYPSAFIQKYQPDSAEEGRFLYDGGDLAASSVGGASSGIPLKFEFVMPQTWRPSHIVVRQMRAPIPRTAPTVWTERDLAALKTNEPPPRAGGAGSTKPWLGYVLGLVCVVMVMVVTVQEPKRSHQD
ncbi:MAG: CvpA family protein [Phycisphaerales bacterium]|nr:CvpA family protein [Phycisphaerales bacterium]